MESYALRQVMLEFIFLIMIFITFRSATTERSLPLHAAKKITIDDEDGETMNSNVPNWIKFEFLCLMLYNFQSARL